MGGWVGGRQELKKKVTEELVCKLLLTTRSTTQMQQQVREKKKQVSQNERMRKEPQHGWRRKSFPERKSASRGNCFWHLKGQKSK